MASPIVVMGVSGPASPPSVRRWRNGCGCRSPTPTTSIPPANIAKMTAGHPLDDDDRRPVAGGDRPVARRACGDGGVMSCSALKRAYRDQLRRHCPDVEFLHLSGTPEVIGRRQASRPGHFMPASLLASQFATLEPLERRRTRRRHRRRSGHRLRHRATIRRAHTGQEHSMISAITGISSSADARS